MSSSSLLDYIVPLAERKGGGEGKFFLSKGVGRAGLWRVTETLCVTCYFPTPIPGIIHARALVRECLAETERNART